MSVPIALEITLNSEEIGLSWEGSKIRAWVAVWFLQNEPTLAICCHLEEQVAVQCFY